MGGDSEPEINQNIGLVYFSIDYYPKAEKYLKNAISLRAECNLAQFGGYLLSIQGRYDEAFNYLDSISNITACEQACDIMRFRIYTTQNELEKAEEYFNKAVAAGYKRSDNDDIYLAFLFKETGRTKEALSILNNHIKRNEAALTGNIALYESSIIYLQLVAAYTLIDENLKAMEYFSEVEKLGLYNWPIAVRTFPGFDKLRRDTEFNAILKRIEDKKATIRTQIKEMEGRGEIDM